MTTKVTISNREAGGKTLRAKLVTVSPPVVGQVVPTATVDAEAEVPPGCEISFHLAGLGRVVVEEIDPPAAT